MFVLVHGPAVNFDPVRDKLSTNDYNIICVLPEIVENNNDIVIILLFIIWWWWWWWWWRWDSLQLSILAGCSISHLSSLTQLRDATPFWEYVLVFPTRLTSFISCVPRYSCLIIIIIIIINILIFRSRLQVHSRYAVNDMRITTLVGCLPQNSNLLSVFFP